MIERLRKVLFFALFFSFALLLGKHFWPEFSFVHGVRVDYLSPALYFSDLVIFALLLFEVYEKLIKQEWKFFGYAILLAVVLASYIPFVDVPQAHIYGSVTLLKFIFVGYVVAEHFRKEDISLFLYALSFGVLIQSLLAIGQLILQEGLQGPFYFLGERAIYPTSVGAATFSFFGNSLLRPYGSFPHPNILAFYLFLANIFLVFSLEKSKNGIFLISSLLGSVALLLTFSRVIILIYIVLLVIYFLLHSKKYLATSIIAGFILYILVFLSRFELGGFIRDLSYRKELFEISTKIVADSLIFGEGLLNYYYEQIEYHRRISPIFLQPVHNTYMIVLVQLGIFGLVAFFVLIWKTLFQLYIRIKDEVSYFDLAIAVVLLVALFVGIFDHFFFTLQQGQLMMAVILGLAWRKA